MRREEVELLRIVLERGMLREKDLDMYLADCITGCSTLERLLVQHGVVGESEIRRLNDEARKAARAGAPRSDDEARFHRAFLPLQSGRFEEAVRRFREMARTEVRGDRADVLLRRLDRSEEGLNLAVDRQPRNYDIRVQRGLVRTARAILSVLGGRDPGEACRKALDDLTSATTLRPEGATAYVHRANLLLFCARFAKVTGKECRDLLELAMDDLNRACRHDPSSAPPFHDRGAAAFYLARELKRGGGDADPLYARAIEDFKTAHRLDPADAFALRDLGVALMALAKSRQARRRRAQNLYEEAREHLSRALQIDADLSGTWVERGQAHYALERFEQAVADWERAVEINPARREALDPLIRKARRLISVISS